MDLIARSTLVPAFQHQLAGQAVTRSNLGQEVRGSNVRPVKSNTLSPALTSHCEYNERFDFDLNNKTIN